MKENENQVQKKEKDLLSEKVVSVIANLILILGIIIGIILIIGGISEYERMAILCGVAIVLFSLIFGSILTMLSNISSSLKQSQS